MKRLALLSLAVSAMLAGIWLSYMTVASAALPEAVMNVPAAPYDETADAHAQLAAALAAAKAENKRVLLKFGANWCPDCRVLAGAMEIPQIKMFVDRRFETVSIDVGRRTRNMDIAARYGQALKFVPTVVVLDSAGNPVPGVDVLALGDARTMKPAEILEVLKGWAG